MATQNPKWESGDVPVGNTSRLIGIAEVTGGLVRISRRAWLRLCEQGKATASRVSRFSASILFRDERKGVSRIATSDIARRGGLSRRAVQTALAKLRRKRLVVQVYRGGFGRGLSVHRVTGGAD